MAKTRSQTRGLSIKKEGEEEDRKPTLLLNGVNSKIRNKITKRKPSKNRSRNLVVPEIKVEEDTDIKSLLQTAPNNSKLPKERCISQEQINQLIDYVVNDKLSVYKAAPKANMSRGAAHYYYTEYKNDPNKRIPSPKNRHARATIHYTQEQIKNVIKYMNDNKMSLRQASVKANMSYQSVRYYYRRYLNDPNHSIPIPFFDRRYTQDQKRELMRYIIDDKMSIRAASRRAKINAASGIDYCREYFKNQHPDIPTPSHIAPSRERYTQEQIKKVIGYIINDKMSIRAASIKGHIDPASAGNHYRRYLKDNNMEIPVSKVSKRYTQDKINEVIGYIVDDKMSIAAASKNASIATSTGHKYYHQYLNNQKRAAPTRRCRAISSPNNK